MAKRSAKKTTKARAAKTRATKKKVSKRGAQEAPAVEPQPSSFANMESVVAKRRELTKLGKELVATDHGALFDADISDVEALERRGRQISDLHQSTAPELAFILHTLAESARHLDRGHVNFDEYVESEFQISPQRAKQIAAGWAMFTELGLDKNLSILRRISWTKFSLLRPLFRDGLLSEKNVYEWLPFIDKDSPMQLTAKDVTRRVNALRLEAGSGKDKDTKLNRVQLVGQLPHEQAVELLRYRNAVERLAKEENPDKVDETIGKIMLDVFGQYVNMRLTDTDTQLSRKAIGVYQAKAYVENLLPGSKMILVTPQDDDHTYENLGVLPAHRAFTPVDTTDNRIIIAVDAEEAMAELDVDEVRELTLSLSASYSQSGAPVMDGLAQDLDEEDATEDDSADEDDLDDEEPAEDAADEDAADEEADEEEVDEEADEEEEIDEEDVDEEEADEESDEDEDEDGDADPFEDDTAAAASVKNDRIDCAEVNPANKRYTAVFKSLFDSLVKQADDKEETLRRQMSEFRSKKVAELEGNEDQTFLLFEALVNMIYDMADERGIYLKVDVPA